MLSKYNLSVVLDLLTYTYFSFIKFFRINKDGFLYLMPKLSDFLKPSTRCSAIPPILKLCCALRFFADGSYQRSSGNDFNIGVSQPTVCLILKEIIEFFERKICKKWINARMTEEEKNKNKMLFFSKTRFPGVIGCIDGTHVRIVAPRKELQHLYLNRKGYYSLNVMIVRKTVIFQFK